MWTTRDSTLDAPDPEMPTAGRPQTRPTGGVERGAGSSPRATYSQRVAKVKPTAMKPMPTTRFFWPRSLKTGTLSRSLLKT